MRHPNRMLTLLLVCILALSYPALALSYAYQTDYTIGNGTVLSQIDGGNASGNQRIQFITYTPNSSVSPTIVYGNTLYGGAQTITQAAAKLESEGKTVIGGINADYFVTSTGVPIGVIINDGELVSSDAWQQAVGFYADGSAIIGRPQLSMRLYGTNGSVNISYYNKTRTTAGFYLLDDQYYTRTLVTEPGVNVVMEKLDDQPVTVGSSLRLRVVSIDYTSSSTTIGDNQMVLTVNNNGPVDDLPPFQVGDELTLSVSAPNTAWNNVVYAVGGQEVLIQDGVVQTTSTATAPRTAVGVKADGSVVLYEADGRGANSAAGLSLRDLANEMLAQGCVSAINLDGGGSSSLIARLPGEESYSVINTPSDGSLRRCSTFIMLVNNAPATGTAAHLTVYPEDQYLMTGASTTLTTKATDANYHPAATPEGVSISASSGTVSGNVYTAGTSSGKVTFTAQSDAASGSGSLYVLSQCDSMTVTREGSTSAVTSLSLSPGQTVDLSAYCSYRGLSLAGEDSLFSWAVTGGVGTITQEGVFTAASTKTSGVITVTYGGITKTVSVSLGLPAPQDVTAIASFESVQPFPGGDAFLTSDTEQVRYGNQALGVDLPAEGLTLTCSPISISSLFTHLQLWVQAEETVSLSARFQTSGGQIAEVPLTADLTQSGFTRYSAALPEGTTAFVGLGLTGAEQTLYLDQITVSAGAMDDTQSPAITRLSATTPSAGQSATLSFQVTDQNASCYVLVSRMQVLVDGVSQTFSYNANTGTLTVTTPALAAGQHRVTVQASDGAGNLNRLSVDLSVGSSTPVFSDLAGHWSSPYVAFVYGKGLISGSQDNGVLAYRPDRNLTRAEFAVIMARYLELDTSTTTEIPVSDYDQIPTWALPAICAIYDTGIMTGRLDSATGEVNFDATATITRAEVMTVLGKLLPQGYPVSTLTASDRADIPAWALDHVTYLTSLGLVTGYEDGTIRPLNNITRGEIAKILYSLY